MRILAVLFVLVLTSTAYSAEKFVGERQATVQAYDGANIENFLRNWGITRKEFEALNPGVTEKTLKAGGNLKTPAYSNGYKEWISKLAGLNAQLAKSNAELETRVLKLESQLKWHPIWLWGFWILFVLVVVILAGLRWMYLQQNPKVFDKPHERNIVDISYGDIRKRRF